MKASRREIELAVAARERVNAEMHSRPLFAVERVKRGANAAN